VKQISFYPGPSRVYSQVPEYILDAYSEGLLSANHRSAMFMDMIVDLKRILQNRLDIPNDYSIVFTSSATECWEIIAQSLTRNASQHFYNGAFGEKWMKRAGALIETFATPFDLNATLPIEKMTEADVICVTQNETSNGSQIPSKVLKELRAKTDQLIAVDATSSMGGIHLDFKLADVWFASVQKCFGLPAGMGVMILSPQAIGRSEELNDRLRYNSLLNLLENWNKNQAPYTPNVLGLYLLLRTQKNAKHISEVEKKLKNRHTKWVEFLDDFPNLQIFPENDELRSTTVLTIQCPDPQLILQKGEELEITFGKGYDHWKESTFRIANFPAIKRKEIDKAQTFLRKFC
jgi:phosphoserine aminotransferase